jgi:hypothetical protein
MRLEAHKFSTAAPTPFGAVFPVFWFPVWPPDHQRGPTVALPAAIMAATNKSLARCNKTAPARSGTKTLFQYECVFQYLCVATPPGQQYLAGGVVRFARTGRRSMNHSIYSADRTTHLTVVIVALIAGILVAGFGISMRNSRARDESRQTGNGPGRVETFFCTQPGAMDLDATA